MEERPRFYSHPLQSVLEKGLQLYVDTYSFTCVLIETNTDPPEILEIQHFTSCEMDLLLVLFDHYPQYAPHDQLYAAHYGISLVRAQGALSEAKDDQIWDDRMRPLRSRLSRVRIKLLEFGLDIKCLMDAGYVLIAKTKGY